MSFNSQEAQETFHFSTATLKVLGPTSLLFNGHSKLLFTRVKRPGLQAND